MIDKNRAQAFAAKAKEKNSIEVDKKDPNRAILVVGNDNFPLPSPIVKRKGKWSFDTKVGRQEILNRRIGANELDAITICRGFVEAMGGTITAMNRTDRRGALFVVTLPVPVNALLPEEETLP